MDSNIFIFDVGMYYFLVDINSLCTCKIDKTDFTRDNVERAVKEHLSDSRPYFERLKQVGESQNPIEFVIVTSFACNYSCEYCYQKPSKSIYDRMKPDDIDAIYQFYQEYSQRHSFPLLFESIGIMGGEPLLPENRDVLQKIASTFPNSNLRFVTNGTFLAAYEDFLLSNKTEISVSLDGTEKTHYSRRKTGDPFAYRKAIEGIKRLLENDKRISILILFSPENINDYSKFFDEMEALGWRQNPNLQLVFQPEVGSGNDDRKYDTVMRELEAYKSLRKKDPRVIDVIASRLIPGAVLLEKALEQAEKGLYTPYRCSALNTPGFAFLPDGSVMPCLSVQDRNFSVGRFKPKIEIKEDMIAALVERRVDRMERCKACRKRVLCCGGCLATAVSKTGDVCGVYCDLMENTDYLKYYEMLMLR